MRFRYKTILFDFDGTLTPSLPLWMQAYRYAFEQLGITMSAEEVISKCFYRPWAELVKTYGLPSAEAFGTHVHDGLDQAFVNATLFDGAITFLDECRSQAIKLGIVTSCGKRIVDKFLNSHKMTDYFITVITADDVTHHKPHPEPIEMALSHLQSEANGALLVGDSPVDMLAARASGLDSALFFPDEHHIFYDFDHLKSHEPHYIFHNYCELRDLVAAAD